MIQNVVTSIILYSGTAVDLLIGINKEATETGQSIENIIENLAISEQTKKLYKDFLNFAKFQYFGNNSETTETE